MFFADHQSS